MGSRSAATSRIADTRGHFTQRGNNVNGLLLGLFRTPPNFNNLPYLDPTTGLHRSYMVPERHARARPGRRALRQSVLRAELRAERSEGEPRTFGNVNAEYIANSWLKFNYTLGADYSNDERLEGCPAECSDVATGGRITEGKLVDYQLDHNLTGTANWHLSDQYRRNGDARPEPERAQLPHVLGRWPHAHRPAAVQHSEYAHRDPPSDYQNADSQRVVLRAGDVRPVQPALPHGRAAQRRLDDLRQGQPPELGSRRRAPRGRSRTCTSRAS